MLADLRLALRMLAKAPAFATLTVLALALGIGASTTTFSAINALLLKPWPYVKEQEQVVFVSEYFPKLSKDANGVAYPDYLDLKRDATKTIEGLGISNTTTTGQGMRLIAIGLGLGSVAAFFLTKLLEGNLAGVSVHDPWSFGIVALLLAAVGLLASYLPARKATRVNPIEALRYE